MKIAGYEQDGQTMAGLVDAEGSVRALGPLEAFWNDPKAALERPGEAVGALSRLGERPAIPLSARVICIGLNYRKHAEETGMAIPTVPIVFARWANTLAVSGTPAPRVDDKFDYECELGAVIGKRMFRVTPEQAKAGIFGYAAFNDLSARDLQMQTPQWILGKNTDASGPITPIVTADAVGDPADGLRISTRVNGKTVQDSTTADMIFTVPELIAHLSQAMTLEPGDLIVTGTPSGVAMATGNYLQDGDTVEVEIERIGTVSTPIVAAPAPVF